ncbi:alcohol dehydrogenase [Escherichia coli]|nr:alcohol dehydrogenase [Escherichia coli]
MAVRGSDRLRLSPGERPRWQQHGLGHFRAPDKRKPRQPASGTVAKLAMRQPFVLFKGLTFQKLCLPGAFRPGDHHNKMLRPGLCVVHASPQYL